MPRAGPELNIKGFTNKACQKHQEESKSPSSSVPSCGGLAQFNLPLNLWSQAKTTAVGNVHFSSVILIRALLWLLFLLFSLRTIVKSQVPLSFMEMYQRSWYQPQTPHCLASTWKASSTSVCCIHKVQPWGDLSMTSWRNTKIAGLSVISLHSFTGPSSIWPKVKISISINRGILQADSAPRWRNRQRMFQTADLVMGTIREE